MEIFSSNVLSSSSASPLPVALEESLNSEKLEIISNQSAAPPSGVENKVASSLTPNLSLLVELWGK